MTLSIRSTAFQPAGPIPSKYTCDGDDISPPLDWSGVPGEARSLALIVEDPDAPDPAAPKRVWVHWVLYDIPPTAAGLAEGAAGGALPQATRVGKNDWGRAGYGGPCPPIGCHRYFFRLFALDRMLGDLGTPGKRELEAAMAKHALETAELVGTYERAR